MVGIPAPYENPLVEEVLEAGTVMHADIAIAPRLHKIMAAIRAIRVMALIIFPRRSFANRRNPPRQRANLLELGWPPRTVLASTPRGEPSDGSDSAFDALAQVDGGG